MKTAVKERVATPRHYHTRPGDRISFGGFVYIVSADVATGGLAVRKESDPFYSKKNQERLRQSIADIEAGRVTAHELIEV